MGPYQTEAPEFSFGYRGRMDERPDFCRVIFDGRYLYIRNHYTHIPHGQFVAYQQKTQTTSIWYQKHKDGELNEIQSVFWNRHPREELFDLQNDPHETRNLAGATQYRPVLNRLRKTLDAQMAEIDDLGVLPEPMLREIVLQGRSPRDHLARFFEGIPLEVSPEIELVREPDWKSGEWKTLLSAPHPARRYWTIMQILGKGGEVYEIAEPELVEALDDENAAIAVAAAECVGTRTKDNGLRERSLYTLMNYAKYPENEFIQVIHALNAIEHIKDAGHRVPTSAAYLTSVHDTIPSWGRAYLPDLVNRFK